MVNRKWISRVMYLCFWIIVPFQGYSADKKVTDESVNLALRKVGDQLLRIKGDSTTNIPTVDQMGNLFSLKLDSEFKYGDLPRLLDEALTGANIHSDYHVVIRNCFPGQAAILGYRKHDLFDGQIPCSGREQFADCNIIELRILDEEVEEIATIPPASNSNETNTWWIIPLLSIAALIFSGLYLFRKKQPKEVDTGEVEKENVSGVFLGNFIFDAQNQTLKIGEAQQNLTFREAKILKVFADQPNQIVTRDTLIDEVWGKEGVMVGRSLDVFISRLRKLLKPDEAVNITNIHGVGYKLEIAKT